MYAKAQDPKELLLLTGGTRFDPYEQPVYVDPAIAKIDPVFTKHP